MTLAKRIAAKRQEKPRSSFEVVQWGEGDSPCVLYFTPVSARDIDQVSRKHPTLLRDTTLPGMVDMIIRKCEDESGDPVFTLEDKPILMGEQVTTLTSIFSAIFDSGAEDEDQEKN